MHNPEIVVAGDIMIECMLHVPHMPERNSTVIVGPQSIQVGGPAINIAWHLAHLGRQPRVVGFLGRKDERLVQGLFGDMAVDTTGLIRHDGATDLLASFLTPDGHHSAYALADLIPDAVAEVVARCGNPRCLVLNGSRQAALRTAFLRLSRNSRSQLIAFNPSYSVYVYGAEELSLLINAANVTILNEHESIHVCNVLNIKDLQELSDYTAGCIVCTHGKRGSELWVKGKNTQIPVFSQAEGDIVGAGDAYLSGFLHELMDSHSFETAGLFGAAIASHVVVQREPRPVTSDDLIRRTLNAKRPSMANELKMAIVESILQLRALHWSARRIARHLDIDRGTVRKYLRQAISGPKPAIPPAGLDGAKPATNPPAPGGSAVDDSHANFAAAAATSKPAISPAGSAGEDGGLSAAGKQAVAASSVPAGKPGRPSECDRFESLILEKLQQELSAQRIYQDLSTEHGFTGSYDSVKRFVRRLGRKRELPMRRMECAAGEEAQVDFGSGAPVVGADGKRRKTHVFRIVLSHSRKAYSEATFRQTTEDFIGCLENAFAHFGGLPKVLVIDNLRAAVKHPDWFDPELVPKLRSFCQHYSVVILPTKPYMPRHKGKVEAGVKYVQSNALKARKFGSLQEQNEHLAHWEATVADTRIHGTTRQHVGKIFREVERPALRPLPLERFAMFQEAPRKVARDGHIEVAKAYYSVPPEYLRHTVWARWDKRLVRIFNQRFEQLDLHVRVEPGRFSTHAYHLAPEKINGIERGASYLLMKVRGIGPDSHQWAEAMLHARGIEGTRVLQGLLSLAGRHRAEELEKACKTALAYGVFHLRSLRQLIGRKAQEQTMLPFLSEHPIIRPLADYSGVVAAALARKAASEVRFERHDWTEACPGGLQQNGPEELVVPQGPAEMLPPRSGYPLPGCSPAEPDSVSPDNTSVGYVSLSDHLKKENESHE